VGRKKKKAVETYEPYPVRIIDWKVDYSLSLDKEGGISGGPFWEHCSLELQGEFLGPKKMEGRKVTITLLDSRSLDEEIAKPDSINQRFSRLRFSPNTLNVFVLRGSVHCQSNT
jgi:hypothetical protein